MKENKGFDLTITCINAVIIIIAFLFISSLKIRIALAIALILNFVAFFYLSSYRGNKADVSAAKITDNKNIKKVEDKSINIPTTYKKLNEISLINEQGTPVKTWSLYGKTSLLIGKDIKSTKTEMNIVDIDLSDAYNATLVDESHAVLNYSSGFWYIEDLYSTNGVSVKKYVDNKKYRISTEQPYRIEKGDIIYIGLTELKVN